MKKNTRISYMYRDGSNYKRHHDVVVAGRITYKQIAPYLDKVVWVGMGDKGYFLASDVGLPDLQLEWKAEGMKYPTEDDHVWSTLEDMEPTDDTPTVAITAVEMLAKFKQINGNWDVLAAMKRLGIPDDEWVKEEMAEAAAGD